MTDAARPGGPPAAAATSPLLGLLLVLSMVTGIVDAISVLGLGNVFVANMTGNVVFLGFAVAGSGRFVPSSLIVALVGFLLGAVVAGRTANAHQHRPTRHWLLRACVVEGGLVLLAAVVALGVGVATLSEGGRLGMIAMLAAAMGFRNATVRRLGVPDLTTTVLTLTLTGIAADSPLAGGRNPNLWRRFGAVGALFLGALIGAWLLLRFGLVPPLLLAAALTVAATLVVYRHPALAEPIAKKP